MPYDLKLSLQVDSGQTEEITRPFDEDRSYLLVLDPDYSHQESILLCKLIHTSTQRLIFEDVEVNFWNGFVFRVPLHNENYTLKCSDATVGTNSRIQ